MILAAHLFLGALIGTAVKSLPIAILLSFLSHYVLDIIPHTEYSIEKIKSRDWKNSIPEFLKVSIDLLAPLAFILFLSMDLRITFVSLFSIIPDGLDFLGILFPNRLTQQHRAFHQKIHFLKHIKMPHFLRWASQIVVILVSAYLIY